MRVAVGMVGVSCASDGGSHEPMMERDGSSAMHVLAGLDRMIDGVSHRHAICKHCKCLVWLTEDEMRTAERRARAQ